MTLIRKLCKLFSAPCEEPEDKNYYWEDALRMRPDPVAGEEWSERFEHGCLFVADASHKDIDIRKPILVMQVNVEGERVLRIYRWVCGRVGRMPAPMWHWEFYGVVHIPEYRYYKYESSDGTLMSANVDLKLKTTNGVIYYPRHSTACDKRYSIIYHNRTITLQYHLVHARPGYRKALLGPMVVKAIKACDYAGWDL